MPTPSQTPSDDIATWKNDIEKLLGKLIADGFQEEKITYVDMQNAADYVIRNIDKASTEEDVIEMIEVMNIHWPIFERALEQVQVKQKAENEQDLVKKLEVYINSLK